MPSSDAPLMTVLVCTRNRKDNVVPTVRSVQGCGYERFELLVLDQSDDDATAKALSALCSQDSRVRHVRLPRPGKPLALNEGLRQALGTYVVLTDDDCEVASGWLDAFVVAFRSDERIGCVYGAVDAAPHDASRGYIPARAIPRAYSIDALAELLTMPGWQNIGMGASMAVRRDVIAELGGWDCCVGPGTKFGSGDDTDLAIRVLRAGYRVHFSPEARVIHDGFRLWESSKRDFSRIGFGVGALFAKHLRGGAFFHGGARAIADEARGCLRRVSRGQRPGTFVLLGLLRGFVEGLRHPLDRRTGCFLPDEDGRSYDRRVAEVVLRSAAESRGGARDASG